MYCIEKFFPGWRDLRIHESSAIVTRGASKRLSAAAGYVSSQFYPDRPPGSIVDGTLCEDLEKMTFGDGTIDLHVSQDVFEHLLDPAAAFREIARTLRPGGAHVFTTPLVNRARASEFCARRDAAGEIVQMIEPPEFHRNPIMDEGSLVTVRWGYDLPNFVFQACGLFTDVVILDMIEFGIRAEYIEVFITRKPPISRDGGGIAATEKA